METFSKNIDRLIIKKREMALATYIGANVYNMTSGGGSVDILISSYPFSTNNFISIDGIKLKKTTQYLRYNSIPIYCLGISDPTHVYTSISMRTPDISIDKLKYEIGSINRSNQVCNIL